MRCDMCGPYTPDQAAALFLGVWKPKRTGHICERCKPSVAAMAKDLANEIDAKAARELWSILDGAPPKP